MFSTNLHASVRALMGPAAHRVGPFTVGIDAHDSGLFRNYAVPDDGTDPSPDEIAALIAVFTDHARTPRLEYLPQLCPRLEQRLTAVGFVAERSLPVLTCDPAIVVGATPPAGVEVRLAVTDTELWQVADSQNEAYDAGPATTHDLARLRGTRARGGLVALAVRQSAGTDRAAGLGGGLMAPPTCGVAELAAVGVRAAYRRRGIARALTALLTRACPKVGIQTPFLTPAGPAEERIYRSVGYEPAARMLHVSRLG